MIELLQPLLRLLIDGAIFWNFYKIIQLIKDHNMQLKNNFLAICDLRERVRELERKQK